MALRFRPLFSSDHRPSRTQEHRCLLAFSIQDRLAIILDEFDENLLGTPAARNRDFVLRLEVLHRDRTTQLWPKILLGMHRSTLEIGRESHRQSHRTYRVTRSVLYQRVLDVVAV